MGPPEELIIALQQRAKLADFIETGTYRGDTAAWAAAHFTRVTTVELSPEFHATAQERFRAQPNVRTVCGHSATVLSELIPTLAGPALFWLDAHWSGADTAGKDDECPLLAEVALLNASPESHVILVDDARLFCAPPPRPHRPELWPDLMTTVAALQDNGRRHVVLFEDVLVAVPPFERLFLNDWIQDALAKAPTGGRLSRWWQKIHA